VDVREGVAILAMIGEQRGHLSDTRVAAIPDATWRVLLDGAPIDPRDTLVAAPGSRLTLETPGGGGFGSAE
jgi:N-methylhydantoinase B/oxoprolinase/acetone carboxylase alpha subunit